MNQWIEDCIFIIILVEIYAKFLWAMQNQEGLQVQVDGEVDPSVATPEYDEWPSFGDQDIMQQPSAICAEEAEKIPFLGDKEPLTSLAAEYQSGSAIWLEKINALGEQYAAFRRTRGDGNCFFRSFMFSYPICLHVFLHNHEHILVSQDVTEVDRIKANVEQCRKTLQSLGYTDFTYEDFFSIFLEQLDCVLQGSEESISHDELILRSRDQSVSDYVVMFVRFVTSGEIRKRSEFFNPFISRLTNATVEQFCKSSVEPMGEESDHVYITALSDALGVPIRVVYLDRSLCDSGGVSVNHHDFVFTGNDLPNASDSSEKVCPFITLLYCPGH